MLLLTIAVAWSLFQDRLLRMAFVPNMPYVAPSDAGAPDYARPEAWVSHPDIADDPARWVPRGVAAAKTPPLAVFYILPTTYLGRDRWNAPFDDAEAGERQRLFSKSQASAFNGIGEIWSPRYRQAVFGAFLSEDIASAQAALDFAYGDVARAFDTFVTAQPADRPILLAGHSQGALHLIRLLREKVAGTPLARRIVAAYPVGWPISIAHDLPALGLPACATPDQAGCILGWQSFASPADPSDVFEIYDASLGFDGKPRKGSPMLCVNPVAGAPDIATPPARNHGALVPDASGTGGTLRPGAIGARCTPQGLLDIGPPPEGFGMFVLPGNNYHVFDYALFWADIRADATRRSEGFAR